MALFTELNIYKTAHELSVLCNRYVATMDRNYRGTIGADMRRDCREIIQRIQIANGRFGNERIAHIEELRWAVGQVEVAARICADRRIRALTPRQQADVILLTQSIGKQSTGWKQQTEKALANPVAKAAGSMRN
ncbi:four helix bundle protein [Achromobacter veterisilvae]|uniref:four helix bundle protein n=1 Tax=Achromobacter veterisilvae TaxID=2069367 RepID=UPI00100EC6D8|nr:four helix bundle protein [Achromobacter veterisilvae]